MADAFPTFDYHPDPIATGAFVESTDPCDVCGVERGYRYASAMYGAFVSDEEVCPWCIADGRAYETLDAEFNDVTFAPADVSRDVVETVVYRTPGFESWQDHGWPFHGGDACAFLGEVDAKALAALPPDARAAVVAQLQHDMRAPLEEVAALVDQHRRGSDLGIYLFRSRHDGSFVVLWDHS